MYNNESQRQPPTLPSSHRAFASFRAANFDASPRTRRTQSVISFSVARPW